MIGARLCSRAGILVGIRAGILAGILVAASLPLAAAPARAAEITIPRAAHEYKQLLIRSAHAFWGLDAPVAALAAQVHAESLWRPGAVSAVGARGMAQFMPKTADWIAGLYPHLAENAPHNPAWALRALVTYDRYLWDRVSAADGCQRMAKTLAAYNGGLGWLRRDENLARQKGLDQKLCFGGTDAVNAGRSRAAKKENRDYPRRILLELEPGYQAAGFGGGACGQQR